MSQLLKKNSSVIIRYCMGFFLFTQIDRKKRLGYVYTTPQVTPGMKTTLDRASTAAIFKEYFGMPMGIRSVFTRAFRSKRELQWIFLGKKEIIITSKHGTTIFFPITIFFYENLKKKWLEKRA